MAGPGTTWSGPLISGTQKDATATALVNTGVAVLTQYITVPYNSNTWTFSLPAGSIMLRAEAAVMTAITGATAWNVDLGTTASGTDLATMAAADTTLTAGTWVNIPLANKALAQATFTPNQTLFGTLAFTGTATAGVVQVAIEYIQTVQLTAGTE